MKSFLLLFSFCACALLTYGQSQTIHYSYDASGNRTRRYLGTVMMSARMVTKSATDKTAPAPPPVETSLDEEFFVKIYPNPTQGVMRLDVLGAADFENAGYTVYDLNGKVVKAGQSLSASQLINIEHLPNGTYVLSLQLKGKHAQWKVIKE